MCASYRGSFILDDSHPSLVGALETWGMLVCERLTVWSGAGTAIGIVAELMNMHASLGRSIIALDVVANRRWGGFR